MFGDDPRTSTILELISEETGISLDRLTPDTTLDELGLNSLDVVEAVFKIESHFNIEVPNTVTAMNTGSSLGDFVAAIREALPPLAAAAPQAPVLGQAV